MSSTSAPGTVYERPDSATTAQQHTLDINANKDADKRGTPSGIKSGDVEKPRGAK